MFAFVLGALNFYQLNLGPFDPTVVFGQRLIFERRRIADVITRQEMVLLQLGVPMTVANRSVRGGDIQHLGLRLRRRANGEAFNFTANDFLQVEALGPAADEDFAGRFASIFLRGREKERIHIAFQQVADEPPFEATPGTYDGTVFFSVEGQPWTDADHFTATITALHQAQLAQGMTAIVTDEQAALVRALQSAPRQRDSALLANRPTHSASLAPVPDSGDEYQYVIENLRRTADRRDRRFTLYLTVAGFLLLLLFSNQFKVTDDEQRSAIRLVAIVVTVIFIAIELRLWAYWMTFLMRARQLEAVLRFETYRQPAQRDRWSGFWWWIRKVTEFWPLSAVLYGFFLLALIFWFK